MIVRIRTEDERVHEFSLLDSPYASFAELILDGYSTWNIDAPVQVETGEGASSEDAFIFEGWVGVSQAVLNYLSGVRMPTLINRLEKAKRPGDALDELVHF